jgi:hypothetical protein
MGSAVDGSEWSPSLPCHYIPLWGMSPLVPIPYIYTIHYMNPKSAKATVGCGISDTIPGTHTVQLKAFHATCTHIYI